MSRTEARANSIAQYMERIAPSEKNAVAVLNHPEGRDPLIVWTPLPREIVSLQVLVVVAHRGLIASIRAATTDENGKEVDGGDAETSEPALVAMLTHTDDEIARKILVYGAEALMAYRRTALLYQQLTVAQTTRYFYDLIQDGLNSWGAGNTAAYQRPSPHLGQAGLLDPEAQLLQRAKMRAQFWIVINVLMIVVAIIASISTYQDAVGRGGNYIIWWGPVLWGIINIIRLSSRLSKINRAEFEKTHPESGRTSSRT